MTRKFLPFILILIAACTRPEEAPQFRRIEHVEVTGITDSQAYLNADAYFYNPNDVRMKLKEVEVDVILEGNKIGVINQSLKTTIPARAEFKVPMDATFDIAQLGFLNGILTILNGKKVLIQYTGHIKVSMHGFPVKVPIDYTEEVRL